MDKLLKQMGNQIQKELIAKLITASQDGDFDKDTFFTEDHLQALFNDTAADMTKTQKQATKKAKKAKKVKDPNKPSRTNTWMCYCEERRPEIKVSNPNAKFQDIAKMLSVEWKALGDDEKAKYKAIADERNAKNGFGQAKAVAKKTTKKAAAPKTPKNQKTVARKPKAPKKKAAAKPKTKKKAAKKKVVVVEEEANSEEANSEEEDDIMDDLDNLIDEELGEEM
jgi:hypothetical protein